MTPREPRPIAGFALGGLVVVLALLDLSGAMATVWQEVALVVSGALALPFVVSRRHQLTPMRLVAVALGVGITIVAVVSAIANAGAVPLPQFLIGWDGRGTGIYAYAAATCLMAAAMALTRREVLDAVALSAVTGFLSAVMTIVQSLTGPKESAAGLTGLLGNADFNAVICGISAGVFLLLAVRVWRVPRWRPSGLVVLASVCACAAVLTGSWQGLSMLVIVFGVGSLVLLVVDGRRAWAIGVLAGLVLLASVGLLIIIGVIDLPGAAFEARRVYWSTVVETVAHHPFTGVGPDSFAEAVARFRTTDYLQVRPPSHFASAAHSVPMQLAATIGIPALLMWLGLMVTTGLVAVRGVMHCARMRVSADVDTRLLRRSAGLVAVVIGAWVAYVAQALISIDQIVVLALGWILTGSVFAVVAPRERTPKDLSPWRITASVVCAAVAGVGVAPYAIAYRAALSASNPAQEAQVLMSSWTTCVQRTAVASTSSVALDTLLDSFALDSRCPGLGNAVAAKAIDAGDPAAALDVLHTTEQLSPSDPQTWILTGLAHVRTSDLAAATADLVRARDLARGTWQSSYSPGLRFLAGQIRAAESGRSA